MLKISGVNKTYNQEINNQAVVSLLKKLSIILLGFNGGGGLTLPLIHTDPI